ncbi:MAG: type I 3-dehydroquinate dehydratase [Methanobacteriota archaeon]
MNPDATGDGTIVQIVASLSSIRQFSSDQLYEADAVEIRLDLIPELTVEQVEDLISTYQGPIILTLRSHEEGGAFTGSVDAWQSKITPFLHLVTMVDVEIRYKEFSGYLKDQGKTVIASCHKNEMLSQGELNTLYHVLRSFGDIPKIAVKPQDTADLLTLFQFTYSAGKPLIVSVTGTICRYARPLLPLFGSLYAYCYIDDPTSPGQYSLREMRILFQLLAPGIIDTWFEGRPDQPDDPYLFSRPACKNGNQPE